MDADIQLVTVTKHTILKEDLKYFLSTFCIHKLSKTCENSVSTAYYTALQNVAQI